MTPQPETVEQRAARQFAQDIAAHVLEVQLDQGVHRHLRCGRPGTSFYSFAITTWPGHLAISGDMGTFVFARLRDMFEFFRLGRGGINPGYWSEKLVAPQGRAGALTYSGDAFSREVRRWLDEHIKGAEYLPEEEQELRAAVDDEVLSYAHDGEVCAQDAAARFEFDREPIFQGFGEVNCREYDYAYLWCCHAIVWAIAQYDAEIATRQPQERAA